MRILLWYWGRRGAGGQLTLALAAALARRPEVSVALSISAQADLRPEIEALGLAVDAVPTYGGPLGFALGTLRVPALARRLRRQALAHRADVVLSVMTHVWTPLVAPVLHRAGLRYVPIVHDALPHPGDSSLFWSWRLGQELGAATAAIALSASVAGLLAQVRPGLPLLRLPLGAHLPGGVAPTARPPSAEVEFLFFGRLRAYKGLALLRDAFALLRQTHPMARLRIVGEGDAEALAPGLATLDGVRLEQRWVAEAEIPQLMAAADALVLPYQEASQSGVVPFAFACGLPVVATAVGGLAEQVTDGVNGASVAPTAAALAAGMARLCDPAVRTAYATAALAEGRRLVDWDAQAAALIAAIRSLPGFPAA